MSYREHAPHPALAPYVDRYWTSHGPAGVPRIILPDGCIDILVDLAAPDAPIVIGTMTKAARLSSGDAHVVAVRFRPGGATPFLRTPAGELTDRDVPGVPWLRVDPAAPLPSLEASLLAHLSAIDAPDPLVAHAASRLVAAGAPTIGELARDTGFSRQHLARRFGEHVGISPKQLGRVARLQRAMSALLAGGEPARVALDAGYFDQAHMIRDFHELAGLTPGEACASAPGSIRPIRSLYRAA